MTMEQSKIYRELVGGMLGTNVLINLEYLIDFFNKKSFGLERFSPYGIGK